MIVLGIDPGLDGAFAFWDGEYRISVFDMPTLRLKRGKSEKREIDLVALAHLLDLNKADRAFVERVGPMPKQGVSSSFNFGMGYGAVRGLLAAHFIPTTLVTPQSWKKHHGIRTGAGKDASRAKASEILPHYGREWTRVKDDGRAEATLIALYGAAQQ
jgi:crossover junction endodeoxyribonuclease RuvC